MKIPTITLAARVVRTPLPDGSQDIALELIPDDRNVELHQGDEFVTVDLKVDPFRKETP